LSPAILKKINEDNIKKIGIKSIDLFLLPKNKKIYLTNLIDEIFEDLQVIVVFDKLRLNPFYEDSLYNFIKDNQEQFSKNIIQTYLTRSKDLNYLLDSLIKENKTIIGYGASAKSTTFMHQFNLSNKIESSSSSSPCLIFFMF
jgi:hypothetical protein